MNRQEHIERAKTLVAGRPVTSAHRAAGIERTGNWEPSQMELIESIAHSLIVIAEALNTGERRAFVPHKPRSTK